MSRPLAQRLIGLRSDELRRAMPLALAYGLVMAALYVLKPVRNAVFLDRFSVAQLPYAMLIVAVLGAFTAAIYARLASAMRIDRLMLAGFGVFIVSLLAFRPVIDLPIDWVSYAFYVWVALYGLVATSMLWQLANAQFDAREARRVFGIVGVGGISGAVFGGLLTGLIARTLGTDNLLLVAAGLLTLSWFCIRMAYAVDTLTAPERERHHVGVLEDLRASPLLRLIVAMAALVALVAVIADVQFNDVVERTYPDRDDKTAFFGRFFAGLNVFAILLQLFVTPRILTSLGVGAGLLVLPIGLGAGTLGLLLLPGLITGVLPKLADGGLRHSVHRAAAEILFIPVPPDVKKRTKLFVDATVDSLFTGLGALLVLFLTRQLDISYRSLGWLSLGLVGVLLAVAVRLRAAYVGAFREALSRRELDVSELTINISDASTVDALVRALDAHTPRLLKYALDMLALVRDERLLSRVPPLLTDEDAHVRAAALRVLANQRRVDPALARALLEDPDHRVRVEAVHVLCVHGEQPTQRLQELLRHDDLSLRAAAVGHLAEYGTEAELQVLDRELVDDLLRIEGKEGERVRVDVAKALARARGTRLQGLWPVLERDSAPAVVRQTIDSAGQTRDPQHLAWLFGLLDDKRYRMQARLALAQYGEAIVDEIDQRLGDPGCSGRTRRTLPRILARIPSQRCVGVLAAHAAHADEVLRRAIIVALDKLARRFADLRFDDPRITGLIDGLIHRYALHDQALRALPDAPDDRGTRLLLRSLREKRAQELHWLFLLLGTRHGADEMAGVHAALSGDGGGQRANALEYLDNVLEDPVERAILPLLEGRGRRGDDEGPAQVMQRLLGGSDPWLRAATLYAAQATDATMAADWARQACSDRDPLVRETARWLVSGEPQPGGE
ncbi:MAG: Npt1/Npt2 family nucleotide transporter [Myxococcales bacterium]|jgi:AAA family ATP:ADP antiporter